eukprot:5719567-Heterocapsa_arctica.AAC.1
MATSRDPGLGRTCRSHEDAWEEEVPVDSSPGSSPVLDVPGFTFAAAVVPEGAHRVTVETIPSHVDVAVRVDVFRRWPLTLVPGSRGKSHAPIFPLLNLVVAVAAELRDPVHVDNVPIDIEETPSQVSW